MAAKIISKFFIKERYYLNSLNIFSRLNIEKSNSDLINIHWIGNELVSLNDLIKTKKKFYGLCMIYGLSLRLNIFLKNPNKNKYHLKDIKQNFLKKIIFNKKKKLFGKKNIFLITNSKWLENFARKSELTKNAKIKTIYNPLETNFWKRKNLFTSKKNWA